MVEGAAGRIFGEADGSGCIGLRVAIHEERRLAGCGETGREIHGCRCLSYPTFLVGNRDDSCHGTPASENLAKEVVGCKMFHVEQLQGVEKWGEPKDSWMRGCVSHGTLAAHRTSGTPAVRSLHILKITLRRARNDSHGRLQTSLGRIGFYQCLIVEI